jgi:ATP-dependent DNA helicase RecQ
MLHGVDNPRVRRLGLVELSTHGLLCDRRRAWVLALLRRLITAGLVDITGGEFPVPLLTPAGIAVMKGEQPVRMLLPPEDAGRPRGAKKDRRRSDREIPEEVDRTLFERLRAARLDLARQRGIPAYLVCHDRTLLEIAARKPSTKEELAEVHGMGPARIESYADPLLAAVSAHEP